MPTELWLRQPNGYILEALEEGFTKFTWHVGSLLKTNIEVLSWLRSASMGYGVDIRAMLIDHSGAAEYSVFGNYLTPEAVYPTWALDEPIEQLEWLMQNNVGELKEFYGDESVQIDMRPVKGQKHRVVIHRTGPSDVHQNSFMLFLREMQLQYPDCELFISGPRHFSILFNYGFTAADWLPTIVSNTGAVSRQVILPSGKIIGEGHQHDPRYKDWFELVGWNQSNLINKRDYLQFTLRSAAWAQRNFDKVTPFVLERMGRKVFKPTEFRAVSDRDFVLPTARRRVMRNLGIQVSELDKFLCDTCILQNACSLYREGSVCTVKGSETVSLAKNFGTRSADLIITGLGKLLERQVERLEAAQAIEDQNGEVDPDLTKQYNSVFANGVKLAKLINPELSGGARVQVNVGVGAAAAQVSTANPRQLVAGIVAELEAQGIPREQITSAMIKGVLESAASNGSQRAIQAAAVTAESKTINGSLA